MILHVSLDGTWVSEDIDLEQLYEAEWVLGEDDLKVAIVAAIGALLADNLDASGYTLDYIEDSNGNELTISGSGDLTEVAQFTWHVLGNAYSSNEWGKYFAYVDNQCWGWFDFDRMDKIDDEFHSIMEYGDEEGWAKEHSEDPPAEWQSHINWESKAEEMLEGYSVTEWGGETYVFCE